MESQNTKSRFEFQEEYKLVRKDYMLIERHLKRVCDARYTPLSDNGIALLEAEKKKLRDKMSQLEKHL